jgi:flagellar protein FlgJ
VVAPAPAPATYAGTAHTEGGPLNIRSGPSSSAAVRGEVANGGGLTLSCSVSGSYIRGAVRSTSQWDRLTSGNYVSHAYVQTSATLPTCAGGAPVSGVIGPVGSMTNAQFIASAVVPAQQGYREFRVPASVTIAQSILESGWGRSGLTANDRNYFGIKCFSGSPGPIANGCHTYATYECLPVCAPTYATFRTYASITDSFRDHGYFLTTNSRYRPAFNYSGDPDQFLYQIWKAGYATSPTYVDNVKSLMRQYNLYQYDRF